jgi:hypothetical protein
MVLTHLVHLNFRRPQSFGLAQYYPPLKSRIIILGSVHLTHQLRFSLVYSIHRALVIEFTFTLLKPAGDPKSDGCRCGCDFSPMDVATDRFGRVSRVWLRAGFCQTHPVAIPNHESAPTVVLYVARAHTLHLPFPAGSGSTTDLYHVLFRMVLQVRKYWSYMNFIYNL